MKRARKRLSVLLAVCVALTLMLAVAVPARAEPVTKWVVSNYGVKLIAAQADYNSQPLGSAWSTVQRMEDNEIRRTLTVGEILDWLGDPENHSADEIRGIRLTGEDSLLGAVTVGEVVDAVNSDKNAENFRAQTIEIDTTVGEVINMLGREKVREYVESRARATAQVSDYEHTVKNVAGYWFWLILFSLGYAALATVSLELIDHDRR